MVQIIKTSKKRKHKGYHVQREIFFFKKKFSESSQAARHGGCFPPDATVQTEDGRTKKLVDLERGEKVRAMDSDGQLVYSEVLLFLDRSSDEERDFVVLKAEDGSQITLTASHLIYTVSAEDLQEDMDLNEEENWQSNSMAKRLKELNVTVSNDLLRSRLKATFAYKAQIGDWIVVTDASGRAQPQRIVDVSVVHKRGVYAPLTSQGTLVVDNVVVSCYAVIDDQSLAHWAFAPIRILNNIQSSMVHFWKSFSGSVRWWRYHQGTTVSPLSFNPPKIFIETNPIVQLTGQSSQIRSAFVDGCSGRKCTCRYPLVRQVVVQDSQIYSAQSSRLQLKRKRQQNKLAEM